MAQKRRFRSFGSLRVTARSIFGPARPVSGFGGRAGVPGADVWQGMISVALGEDSDAALWRGGIGWARGAFAAPLTAGGEAARTQADSGRGQES